MTLEERLEDARRRRAIVLAARDAARQDGSLAEVARSENPHAKVAGRETAPRPQPPRANQPPVYARRDQRMRPVQKTPVLMLDQERRVVETDWSGRLAGWLSAGKARWSAAIAGIGAQISGASALWANTQWRMPEVNLRYVSMGALLFAAIAVSAMLLRGGATPPLIVDQLSRATLASAPEARPVAATILPATQAGVEPTQPDVLAAAVAARPGAPVVAPGLTDVAETKPEAVQTVASSGLSVPTPASLDEPGLGAEPKIVEADPALEEAAPSVAEAEVTPEVAPGKARVRVFVPSGVASTDATQSLAATVETTAREIDRIGTVEFAVSATHVRFYHEADRAEAIQLAADAGGEARDFTDAGTLPPLGQLELYVAGIPSETVANIETTVSEILDGILN